MANMNMIQALNSAMDIMLGRDPSVVLMGEDIGYFGGVFRATEGLQRKYGEHRVLDTPIAEGGIVATAIGMSVNGLRPVAEIQFADYIYPGFDQIVQRTGAHPLSQRRRILRARDHSHALRRRHSRRSDALAESRGHLHSRQRHQGRDAVEPVRRQGPADHRIEDDDPVVFFEPKRLVQRTLRRRSQQTGRALEHASQGPGGRGLLQGAARQGGHRARRRGQVTIITYGTMVFVAAAAAAALNVDAEIIDLRSLVPLDVDTICDFGEEDRTLRHRARGHALLRVRCGNSFHRPRGMLLGSGSADPARHRLGHSLSARL